jgi:hypothetical protein
VFSAWALASAFVRLAAKPKSVMLKNVRTLAIVTHAP